MIGQESLLSPFTFDPDQVLPPERVYYEGFLTEGDLVVWLGREKHRKTNLILQFAICASLGRDFLGFRFLAEQPLKIVVFDYESKSHSLKRRYEAICSAMGLNEDERRRLKENLRIVEIRKMLKSGEAFPHLPVKVTNREEKREERMAESFWRSLVKSNPADIYILDPMRSVHAQDENDSNIEQLLSAFRKMFKNAAVIVAHHMRKRGNNSNSTISLKENMRIWSDDARGSTAIKAHADTIVCQERVIESHAEVLYWGAFLKDDADIEPVALEESDAQSFFWQVVPDVPDVLRTTYDALRAAGGQFADRATAVHTAVKAGVARATAYRHMKDLANRGILVEQGGRWELAAEVSIPR